MVIDMKGPHGPIVKRLGKLIKEIGLTHYTYRSDREPAIRALLRAAALDAGIPEDRIEDLSEPPPQGDEPLVIPLLCHLVVADSYDL